MKLEQIITEIITLSKEAMNLSLFWEELLNRCQRYLKLIGIARFDKFKSDLDSKLYDLKNINSDRHIQRLQKLVDELNNYE